MKKRSGAYTRNISSLPLVLGSSTRPVWLLRASGLVYNDMMARVKAGAEAAIALEPQDTEEDTEKARNGLIVFAFIGLWLRMYWDDPEIEFSSTLTDEQIDEAQGADLITMGINLYREMILPSSIRLGLDGIGPDVLNQILQYHLVGKSNVEDSGGPNP